MKSNKLWAAAVAAVGALVAVFYFMQYASTGSEALVVLSGNTPSEISHAQKLGPSDPNRIVTVSVGLKLRNEAQLEQLIAEQNDPSSPEYHKFLTPAQFSAQFGPTQAHYDKVVAHLQKNGMKIVATYPNHLIVVASGTAAQAQKAFAVTISKYDNGGTVAYSNDSDPKLPKDVQAVVQSVSGLSSLSTWHSNLKHRTGTAPKGNLPPMGYSPQQMATVYNYPNANNAAAATRYSGKGYTVAIATAYVYNQSDVQSFWSQYGITRTGTVTNVPIGGTTSETNDETTLDLEQIGAQAPGANILMYEGVSPDDAIFDAVFNQIVVDNKADVISVSWGECEAGTGVAGMKTENAIFKQAAAQGIAMFAASGDSGAYDCDGKGPAMSVDYPSSDPYVTAVGGSSLNLNDDGTRSSESAWSGAGGGTSSYWPRPQWQNGLPASKFRMSADVSANADPWTGYAYYYGGNWDVAGGTSFAAPNWSALWILSVEASGGRLGLANASIYRMGPSSDNVVFHDITTGDNGNGAGPGYKAGKGWDHPTGWGVPNGAGVSSWLAKEQHSAH